MVFSKGDLKLSAVAVNRNNEYYAGFCKEYLSAEKQQKKQEVVFTTSSFSG